MLGLYCQDFSPIFSQYGPRAWLIRYIYHTYNSNRLVIRKSWDELVFATKSDYCVSDENLKPFFQPCASCFVALEVVKAGRNMKTVILSKSKHRNQERSASKSNVRYINKGRETFLKIHLPKWASTL